MRQKAGEIQAYQAYEKGAEEWRKENIPRKGKGDISEEGKELLEDKEIWANHTALREVIHESRKRERSNEDGLFMSNHSHIYCRLVSPRGMDGSGWENG